MLSEYQEARAEAFEKINKTGNFHLWFRRALRKSTTLREIQELAELAEEYQCDSSDESVDAL